MEDKHIIQLLWDRAEGALDALARKFGPRIYQTALNILGSNEDARECENDTYLALWNTIPPEKPNPLAAYIYRVSRNIALNRFRTNSAQKRNSAYDASLDELAGYLSTTGLDEILDARALGRAIDAFLDTIGRDSRVIFLRRYWFGDSVKIIAQSLNMQEGAVSVRLSRTKSKLKDYLIKEGFHL